MVSGDRLIGGFVGVNVDAARKFAKHPLPARIGVIGEVGIVPIRRLGAGVVKDWVLTFRVGVTASPVYKSDVLVA